MSNQRGLTRLIQAISGTLGSAGQSFRNNVINVNGASMAEYKMEGSSWANTPNPSTTYADSVTFTTLQMTITTYGARAGTIRNTALSAWSVAYISPLSTAGATVNSVSWSTNVATLSVTINGELTTGTPVSSVSVWYQGYTNPYLPYGPSGNTDPSNCSPNCETAYNVNFTFDPGAIPASGSTTNNLSLSFVPDNYGAGFNPAIYGPGPGAGNTWSVTQNRRPGATPVLTAIQWATDSGFTNVVSSSNPYTISSDNNTNVSYYLRYKLDGAANYTTWASNPVVWQDPRNDT
jgi:hypothetical protein